MWQKNICRFFYHTSKLEFFLGTDMLSKNVVSLLKLSVLRRFSAPPLIASFQMDARRKFSTGCPIFLARLGHLSC